MPTLAEMTVDSQHDHNFVPTGCWHATALSVASGKGIKVDEVPAIIQHLADLADKSDVRPNWADILPVLLEDLEMFYQRGRLRAAITSLLDKMGHAANAAK